MTRSATGIEFFKAASMCLLLSTAAALVFLVVLGVSQPEPDSESWLGALGIGVIMLFVGSPFIVIGALIAYLLWLMLLRERSIRRSAAAVFGVVCLAILVATPWLAEGALFASYLALVLGAQLARVLPWTARAPGDSVPALGRAR